jgi:hypothetical protein
MPINKAQTIEFKTKEAHRLYVQFKPRERSEIKSLHLGTNLK